MQTLTAAEYTSIALISDVKALVTKWGVSRIHRLAIVSALSQYLILKTIRPEPSELLLDEALDSQPWCIWIEQKELRIRLGLLHQVDDNAIAHLIQLLTQNL